VHLLLLVVVALLVAWAVESVGMTAALAVVLLRARHGDREEHGDHGDDCDRVDAPTAGPDDGRGCPAAGGTGPSVTRGGGEPTGIGPQGAPDGHRHGGPAGGPRARGGDDQVHAEGAEES